MIINIVTFTALILLGVGMSRVVLQLSTCTGRWSIDKGRDWVKAAVGFVRKAV